MYNFPEGLPHTWGEESRNWIPHNWQHVEVNLLLRKNIAEWKYWTVPILFWKCWKLPGYLDNLIENIVWIVVLEQIKLM